MTVYRSNCNGAICLEQNSRQGSQVLSNSRILVNFKNTKICPFEKYMYYECHWNMYNWQTNFVTGTMVCIRLWLAQENHAICDSIYKYMGLLKKKNVYYKLFLFIAFDVKWNTILERALFEWNQKHLRKAAFEISYFRVQCPKFRLRLRLNLWLP